MTDKQLSYILFKKDVRVSQLFGLNPNMYKLFGLNGHNGIDFASPIGTPVYSCIEGHYTFHNQGVKGYGLYVRVNNNECEVTYAHLVDVRFPSGRHINKGDLIGYTGNTGFSTGAHLHFGVRLKENGRIANYDNGYKGSIDPLTYNLMTPPKPEFNLNIHDWLSMVQSFKWEKQPLNDCVFRSTEFSALAHGSFMYPLVEGKLSFDNDFSYQCRYFLENEANPKMSPNQTTELGWLKDRMQHSNKTIIINNPILPYKFDHTALVQIKLDEDVFKRYLKKGMGIILHVSSASYDYNKQIFKFRENVAESQMVVKHAMTLIGIDDHYSYMYDSASDKSYGSLPKGVKAIEKKLLFTKGSRAKQGISSAWIFRPDYLI